MPPPPSMWRDGVEKDRDSLVFKDRSWRDEGSFSAVHLRDALLRPMCSVRRRLLLYHSSLYVVREAEWHDVREALCSLQAQSPLTSTRVGYLLPLPNGNQGRPGPLG